MKRLFWRLGAVSSLVLCPILALAGSDPTYTALRAARPDGRTIAVSGLSVDRDVYSLKLDGALHLLTAVEGKTFGAVFVGKGSYTLTPAREAERHLLATHAGDAKLTALTDTFESAVIFDSRLIANAGAPKNGSPDPAAVNAFDDFLKAQRKDFRSNFHISVLAELLQPATEPLFFMHVNGRKYPPALLVVDSRPGDPAGEETFFYTADDTKYGTWYRDHLRSEIEKGVSATQPLPADAHRYSIETQIASDLEITGTTTIAFTPSHAMRVLPLDLMGKLRITGATFIAAAGGSVADAAWIQEKAEEDSDAAIVFPSALQAGTKYLLELKYAGKDVLRNAGDGNYYVGARASWYPNVGAFTDTADFDLTFRHPAKLQVVAVGKEVETKTEGDWKVSRWTSNQPQRVAGFNYGRFKKITHEDKESGITVDVYTNPGEPDIIREINRILQAISSRGFQDVDADSYIGPSSVRVNTGSLAQAAYADAANTARTASYFFGPLSEKRFSITQQSQWDFGQSWPTLIYLPYLAFIDGTTRNTLGLNETKDFVDIVGPHEFAHQWWGHLVDGRSYRDQWISEGFAEFTAALVLQQTKGLGAYNAFWERHRRAFLEKPRGAAIGNDQAGPISAGQRLSSWQNRSAYFHNVYNKGAFILHMLRMMMQDRRNQQNPDAAFIAAMTEFATTYKGRNATTADFQAVLEKHIPQSMKLTTDGKLDWFFREWVHGTDIPKYTWKLDFAPGSAGKYRVTGSITQSQVSDDFGMLVPVYVQFDKQFIKFASLPIVGNSTRTIDVEIPLPKKPTAITVNAMHDVLAR